MKHQAITAIAVAFSLGACASNPDKIAAAYVSPSKYQDFDCEQIAREMDNVGQRCSFSKTRTKT